MSEEEDKLFRHKPTDVSRSEVRRWSALRMSTKQIAERIGISAPTLLKFYSIELEAGRIDIADVGLRALIDAAENGDVVAAKCLLSTFGRGENLWRHLDDDFAGTSSGEAPSIDVLPVAVKK